MIIFDIFQHFPEEFAVLKTLVAAIVAFVLGVLWYHPKIMGNSLNDALSEQELNYKAPPYIYLICFLLWVVASCVYTFLVNFLMPPKFSAMLGLSTFLWVGFVLPSVLMSGLFIGKKLMAMAVDSSCFLAGLYLFAVVHYVL
jgi:hypothetical protein